jgi:hypothetical protein
LAARCRNVGGGPHRFVTRRKSPLAPTVADSTVCKAKPLNLLVRAITWWSRIPFFSILNFLRVARGFAPGVVARRHRRLSSASGAENCRRTTAESSPDLRWRPIASNMQGKPREPAGCIFVKTLGKRAGRARIWLVPRAAIAAALIGQPAAKALLTCRHRCAQGRYRWPPSRRSP